MFNNINTQGNANSDHTSMKMAKTTKPKTSLTIPNAGEDVKKKKSQNSQTSLIGIKNGPL